MCPQPPTRHLLSLQLLALELHHADLALAAHSAAVMQLLGALFGQPDAADPGAKPGRGAPQPCNHSSAACSNATSAVSQPWVNSLIACWHASPEHSTPARLGARAHLRAGAVSGQSRVQQLLQMVTSFGPLDKPQLGRDAAPEVRRMLQVGVGQEGWAIWAIDLPYLRSLHGSSPCCITPEHHPNTTAFMQEQQQDLAPAPLLPQPGTWPALPACCRAWRRTRCLLGRRAPQLSPTAATWCLTCAP